MRNYLIPGLKWAFREEEDIYTKLKYVLIINRI